ncbi:MAG: ribosome small subunit-dependent GTPase A [Lachnospiraceae bacterium]|nr:ribosome small subunit-dependent GTPase A [Lachnospiraceae bacterium]
MQGKIVKGIGGFYYVHDGRGRVYECKARGIFRSRKIRPLVGDDVEFTVLDETEALGSVEEILPRRNELVRPAVANIDQAVLVFALKDPVPNFNLLDRFLIMMECQELPSVLVFNKEDLVGEDMETLCRNVYGAAEYPLLFISARREQGVERVREILRGKTTVLAGPSGVGKSSLLNALTHNQCMETGEVSARIGRGRHTTRHSELFYLEEGTFLMDTPGFTSLEIFEKEAGQLQECYPEFAAYREACRFPDCVHVGERDCGVKTAVAEGKISPVRYENYRQIYQEIRETKKY